MACIMQDCRLHDCTRILSSAIKADPRFFESHIMLDESTAP